MLNIVNNMYIVKVQGGFNLYIAGNGGYIELVKTMINAKIKSPSMQVKSVYVIDSGEPLRITKKEMVEWLKQHNLNKEAKFYQEKL